MRVQFWVLLEAQLATHLDPTPSGPSFRNSCPRGLEHLPHNTLKAVASLSCWSPSSFLERESGWTGFLNAGQGVWCSYFSVLEKRGYSHWLQTYWPGLKLSRWTSCLAHEQKAMISSLGRIRVLTCMPGCTRSCDVTLWRFYCISVRRVAVSHYHGCITVCIPVSLYLATTVSHDTPVRNQPALVTTQ